ncbi:ribosome hibernation-promoting factor, HPF/YfiA family [Pseudodesulfovibrio tunisiensis]|uniref:ribosome hibernation-promoting factor, HPF/YfiA family n=1 Tax=Pseudodesulfovibrio tunisiensis TaxID=463192 RepID=UPI001FB40C01|nr:ribosome-associated translation inhibitor RaiA [Pseudodesulfovibrio tunisiensis]
MNISFTFKNFEPSDHLKGYANKRFEKLGKFFTGDEVAELQVNLLVEKFRHKADIVLTADNIHISAFESSEDMYSTIDMVLDKVEAQLRKMREKMKGRSKMARGNKTVQMNVLSFDDLSGERTPSIELTSEYEPKPMSVDEAAMQLETMDHEFLVFRNAETEGVNVIYKRKNGDFGLIEPGF